MSFTTINHYVPQWYQRRFIPADAKEQKLFYLDLFPEKVKKSDGGYYARTPCRRLGPVNCFAQEHLYTLFFGKGVTDIVEQRFFGQIDRLGADAVEFYSEYDMRKGVHDAFQNFLRYLDAQKLRTPKGLDLLEVMTGQSSHQSAIHLMGKLQQMHSTIWAEGVWEILYCDDSPTKFIISDHPVTTYNKALFPLSPQCRYPNDAPIELIGTHTIFPLGPTRCLVITNLEYVRNPASKPLKVRENARRFGEVMFDLRDVQTNRQISEEYVRNINYLLKIRARRYIAAAKQEWLYPEHQLETTMWNKLGGRFFLMPDPRKVTFSGAIYVGYKDGSSWGADEYGRIPDDDAPGVKAKRNAEFETFQRAKQAWDSKFGPLTPEELSDVLCGERFAPRKKTAV